MILKRQHHALTLSIVRDYLTVLQIVQFVVCLEYVIGWAEETNRRTTQQALRIIAFHQRLHRIANGHRAATMTIQFQTLLTILQHESLRFLRRICEAHEVVLQALLIAGDEQF